MNFLISLFLFILILGFLVFVHELGHFLAAKISKIPVKEFAIGFGPILFQKKIRETHYRLRALPLGGFVSLEGEQESESPMGFRNRSFGIKFFVLIAGIVMNFITAVILLSIFLSTNNRVFVVPKLTDYTFNNVETQYSYYPIQLFNIEEGRGWENINEDDVVVEIDGEKISSIQEFQNTIDNNRNDILNLTFLNLRTLELDEREVSVGGLVSGYLPIEIIEVRSDSRSYGKLEEGERIVGINSTFFTKKGDFLAMLNEIQGTTAEFIFIDEDNNLSERDIEVEEATEDGSILEVTFIYDEGIEYAPISVSERDTFFVQYKNNIFAPVSFTYDVSIYQVKAIVSLLANSFETGDFEEVSQSVGGPIAVGNVVGEVVRFELFETLIPLTAFISLSLAIFNVLPIPALDGGQIAIAAVEAIRRKQIPDEIVNKINFGGFAFLIILSVLIFAKDIDQFNVITSIVGQVKNVLGK